MNHKLLPDKIGALALTYYFELPILFFLLKITWLIKLSDSNVTDEKQAINPSEFGVI